MEDIDLEQVQEGRLKLAGVELSPQGIQEYLKKPDSLGEFQEGMDVPDGYKRCGRCKYILKFHLFNVNNSSKNKCTGNCKACQKSTAAASYERTKGKRDYKAYYADNKERKQAHGRAYYDKNKELILAKQKDYHQTKEGRKVMKKSHSKRRKLLANNKGIPYQREWVIDRDRDGCAEQFPTCYLCGDPIKHAREIQLDHVVPVVLGGKDCFTNIACTHELCNLRKEKDARKLSVAQVEYIIEKAERYIDEHPEIFSC